MASYDVIILKEGNCKNSLDIYYTKLWFEIDRRINKYMKSSTYVYAFYINVCVHQREREREGGVI